MKAEKAIAQALLLLEKGGVKAATIQLVYDKNGVEVVQQFIVGKDPRHLKAMYNGMLDGLTMLEKEIGESPDVSQS